MKKTGLIILCFFILHLKILGQGINRDVQTLDLKSFDFSEYPILKFEFRYFDHKTCNLNDQDSIIWEDGQLCKVYQIDTLIKPINILFAISSKLSDSARWVSYVSNLKNSMTGNKINAKSEILFLDDSEYLPGQNGDSVKISNGDSKFIKRRDRGQAIVPDSIRNKYKSTDLLIVCLDTASKSNIAHIYDLVSSEPFSLPKYSGLFFLESDIDTIKISGERQVKNLIIFEKISKDVNTTSNSMMEFLTQYSILYSLKFKSPQEYENTFQRKYSLIACKNSRLDFILYLPDRIVQNYYVERVFHIVDSLVLLKKDSVAFEVLNVQYLKYPLEEFVLKAEVMIGSFVQNILVNNVENPYLTYLKFENRNRIPLTAGFVGNRLKYFKKFYMILDSMNVNTQERLDLSEAIFKQEPDNKLNEANFYYSRGRLFEYQSKYWQACLSYNDSFKITKDKNIILHVYSIIERPFSESYLKKELLNIYRYGKELKTYFEKSFKLKSYFAESCFFEKDYSEALNQYEWLIQNWTDQPNLTWDKGFDNLQLCYSYTFSFMKAIKLNQRLYRERKDSKSISGVLLDLRLMFLKPCIESLSLMLDKSNRPFDTPGSVNAGSIILPAYLSSITLVDKNGKTLWEIFGKSNFLPVQSRIFDTESSKLFFIKLEDTDKFLFCSRVMKSNYLIFEINNDMRDYKEDSYCSEIQKEPMNNEIWKNLFAYEEKSGLSFFSKILTLAYEINLNLDPVCTLKEYYDVARKNMTVNYLICNLPDGSVKEQLGNTVRKDLYPAGEWEKSVKTPAFYFIGYKDGETKCFDFVNPVYAGKGWNGTLRIGIKPYFSQ